MTNIEYVPHPSATGIVLDNRWEVGNILGKGSYGSVYACKDGRNGFKAAVKICWLGKNNANLQLEKEIMEKASRKNCLHLVKAYDFGSTEDMGYLVMERLGSNLKAQAEKMPDGRYDPICATIVALQMVRAVRELHELRYCHNDIKLDNFVCKSNSINQKDTVYLIDYGLATPIDDRTVAKNTGRKPVRSSLPTQSYGSVWNDIRGLLCSIIEIAIGRQPLRVQMLICTGIAQIKKMDTDEFLPARFTGIRNFVNYLKAVDDCGDPDYAAIEGYFMENIEKLRMCKHPGSPSKEYAGREETLKSGYQPFLGKR